jgi:hypothetical protein
MRKHIDSIKLISSVKPELPLEKPKIYLMRKHIDSIKLISTVKPEIPIEQPNLQKEYIDELNIEGIERPLNEIQLVDQMYVPRIEKKEVPKIKSKPRFIMEVNEQIEIKAEKEKEIEISIIKPKSPLKINKLDFISYQGEPKQEEIKPKKENEIQQIDQMEIIPISVPSKTLIIQNIDRLNIPRDYDLYQYIMKSSEEEIQDVQVSGRPIHAKGKETGLERQDIDNFEILGSIITHNLELEYINSIEIIERNNTNEYINIRNNWDELLEIEYNEQLDIRPDNNEIIGNNNINISHNIHGSMMNMRGRNDSGQNNRNNNNLVNRYYREDNMNINEINEINQRNINQNIIRNINVNYNNDNDNNMTGNIRGNMTGMIIRTIERQNVDNFEIFGFERQSRRINLQIQRINNISVNNRINNNRLNENNNIRINENNNNSINNNINSNTNIMYNANNNINRPRYSSSENNDNNNNKNKINISNIDQVDFNERRYTYNLQNQKISWNKLNNIQQTSKLFIKQTGNHSPYNRGSNRTSWNENNRQQGIVNLSVIDDNKRNNDRNEENYVDNNNINNINLNLNEQDINSGINFNDNNLQSSSRPNLNGNNDYDSDNINNNKVGDFEEDEKEDKRMRESKQSKQSKEDKKSKHSSNISDKNKTTNKMSPKGQNITYEYNTNQSIQSLHSSKNSGKNININLNNKPQYASNKLFGKDSLQGDNKNKTKVNVNINTTDKSQMKKSLPINININKKSQVKPSGLTYSIDPKKSNENMYNININKKKEKLYQPYQSGNPKTNKTYERDSNPRYMPQSQSVAITGKMKKKVKQYELLREPNQSQNFQ